MKYFLLLFFFCGCQNAQKTIVEKSRRLEEALSSGGSTLSRKLSFLAKKKASARPEDVQKNLNSIKERLDFLERNMVSKSDVDSSIELLRRELSEIKQSLPKPKEKPVKEKTLLEQAEENFKNKNWKQAIFAYEEFRKKNPQSGKFAEATLNIGLSFQNLDLKKEGRVFLQEVLDRFPGSPSAKKAKQALAQ